MTNIKLNHFFFYDTVYRIVHFSREIRSRETKPYFDHQSIESNQ